LLNGMSLSGHLSERDARCLWHPYTQHGLGIAPLEVESAFGAYLHCGNGRRVLDAISSWWVNLHGHAHPEIVRAIAEQAARLEHVIFAGFTHEPAVRLAETLVQACRERSTALTRVFFSDNGSTAVEAALKMAFQYHLQRGTTGRTRFVALQGAYHGDTLGAMAVGEPEGLHKVFRPLLAQVDFVPVNDLAALEKLLGDGSAHAAMIVEPMVQGVAGMKMHTPEYLRAASELCRKQRVLLICDEIFTGFYRTGKLFAFEHAGIKPDLVCLSKGLTGGFLPLAATLSTEEIFETFLSGDVSRAFLHGHSYTANPLACAAALASWELLQKPACQRRIEEISRRTNSHVQSLKKNSAVKEVRCLGTIGAVELAGDSGYFAARGRKFYEFAMQRNVLLRPLGNVLYAVPPYCVTDAEIDLIYGTMRLSLDEFRS
jgi:adenosylmethionine-8-amino-7-oxononanoate aminotransferase